MPTTRRRPSTTGDLIRSLLVILVPLVIITFLFTDGPRDHPVKVVDWQPVAAAARSQAPFPVLAPAGLPEGWRAIKATWVKRGDPDEIGQRSPRNQWQLGLLNPDNVYLGLTQADSDLSPVIDQETRSGQADGESQVGEQTWQRRISPDGRTRALLRQEPEMTVIIAGDLTYPALEAYAATLTSR